MGILDWLSLAFGYTTVQVNGQPVAGSPGEFTINLIGTGISAVDNAENGSTDITIVTTPPGLPQRGMTTHVFADAGPFNNAGAVLEWFDVAPSRAGYYWTATGTTAATYNASGFNGKATIDTVEGGSDSTFVYLWASGNAYAAFFVKPDEFTLAACVQYTGTKNFAASTQVCPILIAGTQNNPADGCGLTCGLDPGNSANVIFGVFASDFGGGNPKVAQSASVPKNVAHYVVGVLSGGVLSLYLDGNAPVTTSSVPVMVPANLTGRSMQFGAGGSSGNQQFQGHIRQLASWNVGQTAAEIATTLATLKANGGL